jgi:serine/threonine protein kinase
MIYCLNPRCRDRLNPDGYQFCQNCGSQLILRNRYCAVKYIGGGGFGRTFQALDRDCMNAPCVVKQFSPSPNIQADPAALRKATEMFNQEAVRLLQLGEHPQIPRLLAYFEQDKYLYLVQEFIDGQDLKQELAIEGAFNEQKIRQLLIDLLPVLKFIHNRNVIHRDIKPGNIMRRRTPLNTPLLREGLGELMLIDFGVSKLATGTSLGQVGTTVGTAGYTPLEQMRGQAFPASDLYSLGVTCVCLLTQFLPKADGSGEVYDALQCRWMWREHLPQDITISPQLGQILDKLLQDLPKDRYQSADEVLQDLNRDSECFNSSTATPTLVISRPAEPLKEENAQSKQQLRDGEGRQDGNFTTLPPVTCPPSSPVSQAAPSRSERLISEVRTNYSKLRQLLTAQKWREADLETTAILLKVSNREQEGWIRAEDFKKFPCQDLHTIDKLWVTYSRGRFGFSIQRRVWESLGRKIEIDYTSWCRFGDRLGWRVKGNWLNYSELTFNRDAAPLGHLPAGGLDSTALGKWDLVAFALASRLAECNIQ